MFSLLMILILDIPNIPTNKRRIWSSIKRVERIQTVPKQEFQYS
jgi:hypothetical protein